MTVRLTRLQRSVLEELRFRDDLRAGWGGISLRTLRSLADHGLARQTSDPHHRTFTITGTGQRWLEAHEATP